MNCAVGFYKYDAPTALEPGTNGPRWRRMKLIPLFDDEHFDTNHGCSVMDKTSTA